MTEDTPVKIIVNCETGEQEIIPLTAEEIAEREAAQAQAEADAAARAAEEAAKAEARAALLARLGITEDEAKLLLA